MEQVTLYQAGVESLRLGDTGQIEEELTELVGICEPEGHRGPGWEQHGPPRPIVPQARPTETVDNQQVGYEHCPD